MGSITEIPARRILLKISSKPSFRVTTPACAVWYNIAYSPDT